MHYNDVFLHIANRLKAYHSITLYYAFYYGYYEYLTGQITWWPLFKVIKNIFKPNLKRY